MVPNLTGRRCRGISAGLLICITAAFASNRSWSAEPYQLIPTGPAVASEAGSVVDFRIISGSEAVVPVSVEAGAVIVDVTINGRGPFPVMFDTGAQNAVTPEIAAALGLKTEGIGTVLDSGGVGLPITFTRVKVMRLGEAEMADQPFAVAALPPYLTDRGSRPALAGFIGYELLARFAVRLDYDRSTLTLKAGSDFRYDGTGVRVPLVFTGKTPVVPAAADGIAGMFVVDTGSSGALTLRREFVEDHGLEARHAPAVRIKSIGATGPFETSLMRLDRFDIADSRIDRPATRFPSTAGKGGLPFTDVDGSIGYEILRQFVITIDYQHRELWFEPSRAFGTRTGQGSAGFQAVKIERAGFKIITVLPNTAAAEAGLRDGDVLTEIDGRSTAPMSVNELVGLIRQPIGTLIHLNIIRDGVRRPVTLTLKDVLP